MEPTPRTASWSAWAGWAAVPRDLLERRRVRLTVHDLADARGLAELRRGDWARLPAHQLALYTPQQLRHLIRLESALGRPPTSSPDRWRRPDQDAYWRVQDFLQNVRLERPAMSADLSGPVGRSQPEAPHHGGWEGAARGWAAGAVVLAVLVLLVRALERFLHRKLFKNRYGSGSGSPPRLDDSDTFPPDRVGAGFDLPPPYLECAQNVDNAPTETIDPNKPTSREEPPPPYSACHFYNHRNGLPTVQFECRRNNSLCDLRSTNTEPSIFNVTSRRISFVGCENNDSVDNNVTEVTADGNTEAQASTEEVWVRNPEANVETVVIIPTNTTKPADTTNPAVTTKPAEPNGTEFEV